MFTRLVQKELLQYLLDLRFVAVFAICTLLAALSVYVGSQNYTRQMQAYASAAASYRQAWQTFLDDNNLFAFQGYGYRWNAKPEVLSPVVYGLSGQIGQEANIHYRTPPKFEASLFEEDPVYGLFGVLDLSFIVKIVLSLCVLLFTYDAICGEKEAGTLRLYASFPVPRSSLALAKLAGSTVAVILPFVFAYLLASLVLAFFPGIELEAEDWWRIIALMAAFTLYLAVFAAFGLWISALTQRRMTAFLSLLGLWAIWIFLLPNLIVHVVNRFAPVESPVALQKRADELFWDMRLKRYAEMEEYWTRVNQGSQEAVSEDVLMARLAGAKKIAEKLDASFYSQLARLYESHRNARRRQQDIVRTLSIISPLGAASWLAIDLARTGISKQNRIEDALQVHLTYLAGYILEKDFQRSETRTLSDFSPFEFIDSEPLSVCLSRNAIYLLSLAAWAIIGLAGAYVSILRYDVR